jgi:hypothetical protein
MRNADFGKHFSLPRRHTCMPMPMYRIQRSFHASDQLILSDRCPNPSTVSPVPALLHLHPFPPLPDATTDQTRLLPKITMPPSVPYPSQTGVFATYPMQCHCAAIQYTIKLSPPLLESESEGKGVYTALECDCTHCERKGIIACHPLLTNVNFTQGLVRFHRDSDFLYVEGFLFWLLV